MLNKMFVYGTLKPGHERYDAIKKNVIAIEEGSVSGRLYICAGGRYPGAKFFKATNKTIHGFILTIDPSVIRTVIAKVDAIEGTPQLFRRKMVVVSGGHDRSLDAWAYEYAPNHYGPYIADGSWKPSKDRVLT